MKMEKESVEKIQNLIKKFDLNSIVRPPKKVFKSFEEVMEKCGSYNVNRGNKS
jgi:hypothetical protein